jgi:protein-tyrosine phosphatase
MKPYRRLPLDGLRNARDLGGYPAAGGITKYGRFVRSEAPCALTERDLAFLEAFGVTLSVDFRGDGEVARRKSALEGAPFLRYVRSPTFNDQVAFGASPGGGDKKPPVTHMVRWGEKYIEMADTCRDWVAGTLELLAGADGAALYNCTTGKDRTGIISALLLALAGVADDDIIADYCVSQVYLSEIYDPMITEYNKKFSPENAAVKSDPFFRTDPENMEQLLRHIAENHGGAENYLRGSGVSDAAIAALRGRLV